MYIIMDLVELNKSIYSPWFIWSKYETAFIASVTTRQLHVFFHSLCVEEEEVESFNDALLVGLAKNWKNVFHLQKNNVSSNKNQEQKSR